MDCYHIPRCNTLENLFPVYRCDDFFCSSIDLIHIHHRRSRGRAKSLSRGWVGRAPRSDSSLAQHYLLHCSGVLSGMDGGDTVNLCHLQEVGSPRACDFLYDILCGFQTSDLMEGSEAGVVLVIDCIKYGCLWKIKSNVNRGRTGSGNSARLIQGAARLGDFDIDIQWSGALQYRLVLSLLLSGRLLWVSPTLIFTHTAQPGWYIAHSICIGSRRTCIHCSPGCFQIKNRPLSVQLGIRLE